MDHQNAYGVEAGHLEPRSFGQSFQAFGSESDAVRVRVHSKDVRHLPADDNYFLSLFRGQGAAKHQAASIELQAVMAPLDACRLKLVALGGH